MPSVFISHSSRDRQFVETELVPFLEHSGIATWYAPEDIRTADEWERKIVDGLRSCDWFLIVMSPNAVVSEWVKTEVHWAMEHRKGRVVPLLLEACDPADLHLHLLRIQHIDFRIDRHEARTRLLRTFELQGDQQFRESTQSDAQGDNEGPGAGIWVAIPTGGFALGLLMNDLAQVMTKEDADLVRRYLPWYRRSGPGLLPSGLVGSICGFNMGQLITGTITGAVSGLVFGVFISVAIPYTMSISGLFDRQALRAAERAVLNARKAAARHQDSSNTWAGRT